MQDVPVLVVIVASIRIDAFGPAQWPTANAFDRRDRLDQGDQLRDVIAVGSGQDCRDRCAVRGGLTRSDSFLRFLSGTSEAIMLPI